jgi:hypothetical protein
VRTLQSWRIRLAGPPFVQVGRAIRYRRRDLVAWIDANTVGGFPTRTTAHDLPFIWPSIHFFMASSPPFVTASQSLSETGWLPSITPMFRTWLARALSGLK